MINIINFELDCVESKNSYVLLINVISFELDCVESENSYILLINVINFELRLINFVYQRKTCQLHFSRLGNSKDTGAAVIDRECYGEYYQLSL